VAGEDDVLKEERDEIGDDLREVSEGVTEGNDVLKQELDQILYHLQEVSRRLTALERSAADHKRQISCQLECMRRLQQIGDGLCELRTKAARAPIAKEGEEGYVSEVSISSSDEAGARSSTISWLGCMQERLDEFVLSDYRCDLSILSLQLRGLQRMVREESIKSPSKSLNEIELANRVISEELHGIFEQIDSEFRSTHREEIEKKKKRREAESKREQERKRRLPLPDE